MVWSMMFLFIIRRQNFKFVQSVGESDKNTKWPGSNDNGQTVLSAVKNKVTHSYRDALMNKKKVTFQDDH